jgi:hypothetical protein
LVLVGFHTEVLSWEHTLFVLLTVGTDATDVIPAGFWPESSVFEPDSRRKKLDSGPEAPPE